MSKIVEFYQQKKIDYFLFGPHLTLFSADKCQNYIIIDYSIIYENGARVNTGFVTNLGDYFIEVDAELSQKLRKIQDTEKTPLNKYDYPKEVITSTKIGKLVCRNQNLKIKKEQTHFIRKLDEQKKENQGIFGSGFLVSKDIAEEIDRKLKMPIIEGDAEAKTFIWQLSEREKHIVENLGKEEN